MLKAYSIRDLAVDRKIDETQARNLDIIITRVLGADELGKPGEVKLYQIDKNVSNHKLARYSKEFLNQPIQKKYADAFCDQLADDLLKAEFTEDQSTRNKNILEGSLIIKISSERLILLKLEDVEAIDPTTFEIRTSIGLDRSYLKAAIFTGDESSIHVVDRQRQVANFWSSKFLQLIPVRTDLDNTQIVADAINNCQVLNKETFSTDEISKATPLLAEYITNESHFDLQETTQIILDKFPDKINEVTSLFQHDFLQSIDEQFDISGQVVAAAFRRKIILNELVTIVISNIYRAKSSQLINFKDILSTGELNIKVQDDYLKNVLIEVSE